MKIIAQVVDMIDDELDGAEEYAEYALKCKADHPKLAAKFNELAQVELGHVKQLHTEVVRLIDEYRQQHGEPPKEMLLIYNYEHDKQIRRSAGISSLINAYNN